MTISPILKLFIERLNDYYFTKRKGFYIVSILTFCIILVYANISVLIFHKSDQSVAIEAAILAAILLIGLPVAYNIGLVLSESRKTEVETKSPPAILDQQSLYSKTKTGSQIVDLSNDVLSEDQLNLWERLGHGDETARKELILFYLPLADRWAKRIARAANWADWKDLMQDGVIGLMKAIERFDPGRGVEFKIFAAPYIRGAIFESSDLTLDLARQQEEICRKIKRANDELTKTLQRDPTIEEIADQAGLTVEQILNAIDAMGIGFAEAIPDSEDWSSVDTAAPAQQETPIVIKEALSHLNERERLIVLYYYLEGQSAQEIAERLKLTASNVSKILHRAINKLRDRYIHSRMQ